MKVYLLVECAGEWEDNEVIGCSYHFTSYRYCVTYRIDEIEVEE